MDFFQVQFFFLSQNDLFRADSTNLLNWVFEFLSSLEDTVSPAFVTWKWNSYKIIISLPKWHWSGKPGLGTIII